MNRLEQELKQALRREEPSPGFADRVLARAANEPRRTRWWEFRPPAFRWAAAAVAVALVAALVYDQRGRRERAAGEQAKQQLILALRITGSKLQFTQEKVFRLTAGVRRESGEEK